MIDPRTVKVLENPIVIDSPDGTVREHIYVVANGPDPDTPEVTIENAPLVTTLTTMDKPRVKHLGVMVLGKPEKTATVNMKARNAENIVHHTRKKLVNFGKRVLEDQGINVPKERVKSLDEA